MEVYINVYRDQDINKYVSHTFINKDKQVTMECEDFFTCLTSMYKYLKKISYNEKVDINKNLTNIVLLQKNMENFDQVMMLKYNEIYNLIF
jgi:hypothetical protein